MGWVPPPNKVEELDYITALSLFTSLHNTLPKMATPDDVATFISVTGAPNSVAMQKLEECRGNLNDAIIAYFLESDKQDNQNPLAQSSASHVPDAEIEETMVQAAIEASMMDKSGGSLWEQIEVVNDSSDGRLPQNLSPEKQEDLTRAIWLSLKDNTDDLEPPPDSGYGLKTPHSRTASEEESLNKFMQGFDDMPQVITIAVRMPDGRRLSHCFRKTQGFQDLFDFVDNVGLTATKSRTYRFVRQYPHHIYNIKDRSSTFYEEGIRNNETLYLEWT